VPVPAPRQGAVLQIRCFQCQTVNNHTFYPSQVPGGSAGSGAGASVGTGGGAGTGSAGAGIGREAARRSRKIGTQERPLETGYYELLGVAVDATTEEVKKAYRTFFRCCSRASPSVLTRWHIGRAAIKHHPDKNRDDPNAEERFKVSPLSNPSRPFVGSILGPCSFPDRLPYQSPLVFPQLVLRTMS
jgi:hypothetical protein